MKGCFLAPFLVLNLIHGQDLEAALQKFSKKSTSFKLLSKDEQIAQLLESELWFSKSPSEWGIKNENLQSEDLETFSEDVKDDNFPKNGEDDEKMIEKLEESQLETEDFTTISTSTAYAKTTSLTTMTTSTTSYVPPTTTEVLYSSPEAVEEDELTSTAVTYHTLGDDGETERVFWDKEGKEESLEDLRDVEEEVEEDVKTFVNAVAAACASFLGVAAVGIFITRKLKKEEIE